MALFSLLDSLLFKALPVADPQELVALNRGDPANFDNVFAYPSFVRLHELSKTVDIFAHSTDAAELTVRDLRKKVTISVDSGDFFRVLRIKPALGRLLVPDDDKANSPSARSIVLSHRLWRGFFHGDPSILGKKILLDSAPFLIVGVMPRDFFGVEIGSNPDVAITFAGERLLNPEMLGCKNCYFLNVMGRLKPGFSMKKAEAAIAPAWQSTLRDEIPENMADRYKADYYAEKIGLKPAASGLSYLRSKFAKPLYLLLSMTGTILLISCFNVANMLAARSLARQRELAVRLSIGAKRSRLIRQLLTESVLLAALGLAAALLVYRACIYALLQFLATGGRRIYLDLRPDISKIAFGAALIVCSLAIFGLAPAVQATRRGLNAALGGSSQTLAPTSKFGKFILSGQLALSLTLVITAVLLSRSLHELRTFDIGMRRDHMIVATPEFAKSFSNENEQVRFDLSFLEQVRRLPGVRSASLSNIVPLDGNSAQWEYTAEGFTATGKSDYGCYQNVVSPSYFETTGTHLLFGRDFNERDNSKAPKVAVVSESFARHFWKGNNPLGKRFRGLDSNEWITVVGVVKDAKYRDIKAPAPRTVYLPMNQDLQLRWTKHLEIWTSINQSRVTSSIQKLIKYGPAGVSLEMQTFTDLIDQRLLYERLLSALSICFGCLGALISAVGVFGLASYSVTRRTKEVGIRMALGATSASVLKLIFEEQALSIFAGLVLGLAAALSAGQLLQAWLFGLSPADPASFLLSVLLLGSVASLATLLPARRAAKMQPLGSLRYE